MSMEVGDSSFPQIEKLTYLQIETINLSQKNKLLDAWENYIDEKVLGDLGGFTNNKSLAKHGYDAVRIRSKRLAEIKDEFREFMKQNNLDVTAILSSLQDNELKLLLEYGAWSLYIKNRTVYNFGITNNSDDLKHDDLYFRIFWGILTGTFLMSFRPLPKFIYHSTWMVQKDTLTGEKKYGGHFRVLVDGMYADGVAKWYPAGPVALAFNEELYEATGEDLKQLDKILSAGAKLPNATNSQGTRKKSSPCVIS